MKKLLLSLGLVMLGSQAMSQVIFSVESPAPIAGFYEFTSNATGSSWGLASLTGVQVIDTVVLADDGTMGVNAQGNPASATGCNPLPAGSLAGKIAMVFRGDGGNPAIGACPFGVKVQNCQNAGALAVIIVNRDATVIEMNGGTEGAATNIPVVMVNLATGQSIMNTIDAGNPVVAFIGDKTGYYGDDLSVFDNTSLRSNFGSRPLATAGNAAELSLPFGTMAYNFGQNAQTGVALNTIVTRNGVEVYNQTSPTADIPVGDSAYFTTPNMALASYQAGNYTVAYNLVYGNADEFPADNVSSYEFSLGDLWSVAHPVGTDSIVTNGYYRANTLPTTQFESCIVLKDANASRVATDGAYFGGFAIGATDSTVSLGGFEVTMSIYEWNDADQTITSGTFNSLNEVANGSYVYPDPATNAEQTVFIPLTSVPYYRFSDNQAYLVCINSFEPRLFLAYSTADVYDANIAADDLIRFPIRNDGTTFTNGGFGIAPAIALRTATDLVVNENTIESSAFPNPSKDVITVKVNAAGDAVLKVTDLAGRSVMNSDVKINGGQFTTNVSGMNAGTYVFSLEFANGTSSRFNVVVAK